MNLIPVPSIDPRGLPEDNDLSQYAEFEEEYEEE